MTNEIVRNIDEAYSIRIQSYENHVKSGIHIEWLDRREYNSPIAIIWLHRDIEELRKVRDAINEFIELEGGEK